MVKDLKFGDLVGIILFYIFLVIGVVLISNRLEDIGSVNNLSQSDISYADIF